MLRTPYFLGPGLPRSRVRGYPTNNAAPPPSPDETTMREILRRLVEAVEAGREMLLCQVVQTKGSTPQKAGALMLVDPDGGQWGTLGGGCVEAEVKQRAIAGLGRDGVTVHDFVLDHDYAWADGLICGGRMLIAAEALRGPEVAAYYKEYRARLDDGRGFTEAFGLEPVGARLLFDSSGALVSSRSWAGGDPPSPTPLAERPRAANRGGFAMLPTLPRIRLVVVGAGHVGQAVAELAARADFDVWVVDDRAQYANAQRLPTASRLLVGPLEQTLPTLGCDGRTYALVVTRGHGHDQEALFHLAATPAAYVGLIGSKRKIRMIFENLREQGITAADLDRVSAPVGLDIGSESVLEIAVSIVAELIARRNLGPRSSVAR